MPLPLLPLLLRAADELNMTPEEAESWIVNLIHKATLDAKIDSKLMRHSLTHLQSEELEILS